MKNHIIKIMNKRILFLIFSTIGLTVIYTLFDYSVIKNSFSYNLLLKKVFFSFLISFNVVYITPFIFKRKKIKTHNN